MTREHKNVLKITGSARAYALKKNMDMLYKHLQTFDVALSHQGTNKTYNENVRVILKIILTSLVIVSLS